MFRLRARSPTSSTASACWRKQAFVLFPAQVSDRRQALSTSGALAYVLILFDTVATYKYVYCITTVPSEYECRLMHRKRYHCCECLQDDNSSAARENGGDDTTNRQVPQAFYAGVFMSFLCACSHYKCRRALDYMYSYLTNVGSAVILIKVNVMTI